VFTLANFPAKYDIVPAMLCQNHATIIKGFMGMTTAFRKDMLKPGVLVMGDLKEADEARYIHGELGKGSWTFYGGHDPEDYQHMVGSPPTNLNYYRSSPGYRLILNNVLCPAAKKKNLPTVVYDTTTAGHPVPDQPLPAAAAATTADKVTIVPNPTENELIVSYTSGRQKVEKVVLMNVSGKEVFSQTYSTERAHVDLKALTAGVYLVEVNGVYAGRVVKE
jgi:hypothetical protein